MSRRAVWTAHTRRSSPVYPATCFPQLSAFDLLAPKCRCFPRVFAGARVVPARTRRVPQVSGWCLSLIKSLIKSIQVVEALIKSLSKRKTQRLRLRLGPEHRAQSRR